MAAIPLRKTGYFTAFMLPDPSDQIIRHPGIHRPTVGAAHQIYKIMPEHTDSSLRSE